PAPEKKKARPGGQDFFLHRAQVALFSDGLKLPSKPRLVAISHSMGCRIDRPMRIPMSAISIAVTQVPVREISRAVDRGRGAIAIAISVAWGRVAIIVGWIRVIICIGRVTVPVSRIAVPITVIGSSQRRSDERT